MPDQNELAKQAANLINSELKRKGVTKAHFFGKLDATRIRKREVNAANRLSRGKFSAAFMLACLSAVG
jgi:hypothetical protein